jgi:hypothetical protein
MSMVGLAIGSVATPPAKTPVADWLDQHFTRPMLICRLRSLSLLPASSIASDMGT